VALAVEAAIVWVSASAKGVDGDEDDDDVTEGLVAATAMVASD